MLNTRSLITRTLFWLALVAIAISYITSHLNLVSSIQQFMPNQSNDKRLQVLLHESQNSLASSLLLIQLEGASSEYLAQTNLRLKRQLEKNTTLYSGVFNGDQSAITNHFESLMPYRYLLSKRKSFSVTELRSSFKYLIESYRTGVDDNFIQYLLADPQQTLRHYFEQQSSSQKQIKKIHSVWFNKTLDKSYLMLQTSSTGLDLDATEQAMTEIRTALGKADPQHNVKLTLSGPGVFAVTTRASLRHTTQQVSIVLTILIILLFGYAYNSLPLVALSAIPLLSAIVLAVAMTQLIFSELHGIVLAFGITLLGVCIDYPLHLFSHRQKNTSAAQTLKKIWPTMRLGTLTSILAYLALIGTGFSGLTQLAVFSAFGLATALSVTRWLLPLWLENIHFNKRHIPIVSPFNNRNKTIISLAVIVATLIILASADTILSKDISQINPVSKELRDTDREIRLALHTTDVSHVFLLDADNIEQVLIKTEQLRPQLADALDKKILSSISMASDILPSQQQQLIHQVNLPDIETLKANVTAALKGLTFNEHAFKGFIKDVSTAKQQMPIAYQDILSSSLGPALQAMLFEQDDHWYSLVRISGVNNDLEFNTWINLAPKSIQDSYLSLGAATNVLMTRYLTSASERLLAVLMLIIAVTLWLSWHRRAAIWLLAPVISAVLISLSTQILIGNLINIFHILSLLLVIGMGIDYSLFFNRQWNKLSDLQDRTHAISISAMTTVISFGALGLSEVPVLAAMGQTVSIGILCSFILAQRIAVPYQYQRE